MALRARQSRGGRAQTQPRVLLFLAAWLSLSFLLLLTSENIGYGFTLPLLCPTLVLLVTTCTFLAGRELPVWPGLVALALSALVIVDRQAVPTMPLRGREAFYAGLGMQTGLAHYYGDAGYRGGDEMDWLDANAAAATFATRPGGLVLVGTYPLLSTSSVSYFALSQGQVSSVGQFDIRACTVVVNDAARPCGRARREASWPSPRAQS